MRLHVQMPVCLLFSLAFLAALAPHSLARAQSFVPAPGQQFYVDLDTRDGAFSRWDHLDISALSAAIGELVVVRLGSHDKWLPTFTIRVESDAESAGLSIGGTRQPPLQLTRFHDRKGAPPERSRLSGGVNLSEKLPLRMYWSTNSFSIQIGQGAVQRFTFSHPPKRLVITAATGELEVHGLTLGRGTE